MYVLFVIFLDANGTTAQDKLRSQCCNCQVPQGSEWELQGFNAAPAAT